MSRMIHGLGELAAIFEETALLHVEAIDLLAGVSAEVLHHNALEIFGSPKLRDLEQSTQDDRVAKGYSANEPLKRDGKLLHDHVEKAHVGDMAGIGSAEPVQAAHEYGYFNVRAKKFVAPRPVFKMAMIESGPEIKGLIDEALSITFGGSRVTLKP